MESCECVFKLKDSRFEVFFIPVYYFDLFILNADKKSMEWINNESKHLFKLTELGELHY